MEYEHTVQTPARRSMIRTVTTVNFNVGQHRDRDVVLTQAQAQAGPGIPA